MNILHPAQTVVHNNAKQLVAYSQSESSQDETLQEAGQDILVDNGEGKKKAEMPVDNYAYLQIHTRALLA